MERYYLGIDNGGTTSKAALFDSRGREVAVCSRAVENIFLSGGGNERNADLMWEDTAAVIRDLLLTSAIGPDQIKAVACTGHGNGLYLVDDLGNPVRNAINSTDSRAQSYIENWIKKGADREALPLTAQSLWAAQPNALLSWLRDHEKDTLEKARWILMAKDFVRYKLTGEVYAEVTDMSGTSLMNVVRGTYDTEVLRIFGLEEFGEMLPPLIGSTDHAGTVTQEAARRTGLKAGTPVAGGMFDIDACGLASGIVDEGQMSMVIGTWGNNQYISREPLIDPELFMTSIYSIPGWFLMLEGSPTSAGNLDWFIQQFFQAEQEQMGESFFPWLSDQVEGISPSDPDLVFLPFLYGNNVQSTIPALFYGLKGEHTRAHLLRAVFEGIVFSHKSHILRLLNFREIPDVIRCTGGATQSNTWMQLFADAIGMPLEVPAGRELGALGAAMAASVCVGDHKDLAEAAGKMTSIDRRFEPRPDYREILEIKYLKYQEIIQKLKTQR